MNKIYKVIWSKVKNQYVVVSELAHSNGKQSRTSRNSIRSRIAALVVCGAIAAFGVFSALPNSAFAAATGADTKPGQYIAVALDPDAGNDTKTERYWNGHGWSYREVPYGEGDTYTYEDANDVEHTYNFQTVNGKNYWVRDGYKITITENNRFTAYDEHGNEIAPEVGFIIDSEKSDNADSAGLISSGEVLVADDEKHTTLTKNPLNTVDVGIWGGATNSGGTEINPDWNYYINDNGKGWKDVGGKSNFRQVHLQSDGTYNTKLDGSGIEVSTDNLYVVDGILGAFFNSNSNEVYTGRVYGHHNEVLMTAYDEDTDSYYSYWGTKINDRKTSLSELTVGDLQDALNGVQDSIYTAQGDDIKKIDVAKAKDGNGGTIGLVTRGDWKSDGQGNGQYVDTDPVPGTITIRNTDNSGKNGNDVAIRFGSIDEEGQDVEKFTIDAGSKVVGKTGADGTTEANPNDTLTGIEINGQNYKLGGGKIYTDGDGIAIDDENDNKISVRLKDDETNLTVDDTGLALADNLNVTNVTATNNITANSMSVTEVGNNDNSVVNVGYFKDNEKHIKPTTYAVNEDGSVTMTYVDGNGDTVAGEAKITGIATKADAVAATTEVEAGTNVASVEKTKDETDGHTVYTVNAKGTEVTGDSNVLVTSETDDETNVTSYNVTLNDNITLGDESGTRIQLNGNPQKDSMISITNKDSDTVFNVAKDGTVHSDGDIVAKADSNKKYSLSEVGENAVRYNENKSTVALAGTNGTTITNVANGINEKDAVNVSQLNAVDKKVNAGWTAKVGDSEINVRPNGENETGKDTLKFAGDDNITVTADAENNAINVELNDDITLGEGNNQIRINGSDNNGGKIVVGQGQKTVEIDNNSITLNKSLVIDGSGEHGAIIHGLSNNNWNPAEKDNSTTAATEGQLYDVYDGSVKYWQNQDGTYDKSFIQLEGGEEGTTITHLKDGVVAEYSTEAINGSQLWETQQQIKDVETTANKHTIVSTTKDSNLTVKNVAGEGEADNYQVSLNDDITLKGDSSSIELTGTKGTIQVNQETAEGTNFTNINGNVVSIGYTNSEGIENAIVIDGGKGTITGLSNTTWDDELAKQVANSEELQGTAATQGQLQQAVSAVATEAAKQHTTVSGDDNLTVTSKENTNGGTNYQVTLNDDITLGNPKAGNTEGERSFTINTTDPNGYVPESYKTGSGANFIEENGGFMLFATDTRGFGVFGVTAKGSAWAKDFKTYTTDIYGNNTQYSLNEIGDAVAQMSSYYNEENGKSYTVFSRYLNEAEKDNPFVTVDENATRDIPLALRDDGAVLIGATIKGEDFTDNGIRINGEIDDDGNNVATITGLENTTWTPPAPVATFANEGTETSRAATEAQLNDLYGTVVGYNVDTNGVNYGTVTLGGGRTSYDQDTHEGGTVLNNVAYASGTDGSEAVNVDYLKDAISDAAENGSISTSDQHLVANTETGSNGVYKPNDDGNVNLIVSDEKGNSSTITIGDVASKTELDSLKTNVGDLSYSKVQGDDVKDGDSVTTAIGKLDNKIENISGTATDADNNTVTGGKINSDGTISLTQKDKDSIKLEGQLTDSGVVQEGTSFDKETGTITITSQDKYSGETSSVKVEGIASTEVVGATNKEDLATAYKDADKDGNATTEYITDSESMVEADVALDHAIQDVAGTSYANDMVLSNRIDSVEKRLGNVEERIDKVGAMAAAIANLRTMGFDPEAPTEIAIGVGQYKSETGIAIGVFHYPNQDFMLSASLSSSGDELMGGIGATWKLGRKSAAERAKDEEARHLEQAEEMKKLAQQEKVKAQAQRHAKLLAERQQASQKNA